MSCTVGLMSGTSFDGVDAVIFDSSSKTLIKSCFIAYSETFKAELNQISNTEFLSFDILARLNSQLTNYYIEATKKLLIYLPYNRSIDAIGAHGQTICHAPENPVAPFTHQLINGSLLATSLNLPVICDFRSNDIALGGQGAPLAPVFHEFLFNLDQNSVVINLGGIANISYLDLNDNIRGFDTGPANCLLDKWIFKMQDLDFDNKGQLAAQGIVIDELLNNLMLHPYLLKALPKSADKEDFSLSWLESLIKNRHYSIEDVQATLMSFTVTSIVNAIKKVMPDCQTLILCGGGIHNLYLLELLARKFETILSSDDLGYESDYIEAMMMAWLAGQRLNNIPIDLTTVTGSSRATHLGAIYLP